MSSIKSKDTRPELLLRAALRAAGIRGYRCNLRGFAGTPDIAFTRQRLAVFVDGVWWHGHPDYFQPGKLSPYWDAKIAGNVARDAKVSTALKDDGWTVLRFWDVEVARSPADAVEAVVRALSMVPTRLQGES